MFTINKEFLRLNTRDAENMKKKKKTAPNCKKQENKQMKKQPLL